MRKEETIGFTVKSISNLIKRRIHRLAFSEMDHMTGMHGWIIGYLYDHREEEIFQRDLEEVFSVRRSTASSIVQLMEKNDLIIRSPVSRDGRLKQLILTEKAIQIQEKIHQEIGLMEEQMRRGIPEEEMQCFFKTAAKIKANLEENMK